MDQIMDQVMDVWSYGCMELWIIFFLQVHDMDIPPLIPITMWL